MPKVKEAKVEKKPERAKVEDVEAIIIDLAKKGTEPAQIGQILKEKHGVPNIKILGKRITRILKENNISYQKDAQFVDKKVKNIAILRLALYNAECL